MSVLLIAVTREDTERRGKLQRYNKKETLKETMRVQHTRKTTQISRAGKSDGQHDDDGDSHDDSDIGSEALVHGCTVADGAASCPAGVPARTSFQEAREVGAAVIRSGLDAPLPRPPAGHFLWSTIAPFLPRTARWSMFLPD